MPAQRPWLVLVAAPKEVSAALAALGTPDAIPETWGCVRAERAVIVRTGVGKWAAAGAAARWYDPARHAGVLSFGVAGALPGSGLPLGAAVLADPSRFADEGLAAPDAFVPLSDMGFPDDAPTAPDPASRAALAPLADRVGPIATVSTCAGTDALARAHRDRAGAVAEAMEGAAAGAAVRRTDPRARFAELRVVSNTTGNRPDQAWDLPLALARMTELLGPALDALSV